MTGEQKHGIDYLNTTATNEVNRFRNRSHINPRIIEDIFICWKMPHPGSFVGVVRSTPSMRPLHSAPGTFVPLSPTGTEAKETNEYR